MEMEMVDIFYDLGKDIVATAKAHGFDSKQDPARSIALMHSELSEALEGYRHNNPSSKKIPDFSSVEEELADVVIRVIDHAHARGYNLAQAILAKMEYNRNRPMKHGGKEY